MPFVLVPIPPGTPAVIGGVGLDFAGLNALADPAPFGPTGFTPAGAFADCCSMRRRSLDALDVAPGVLTMGAALAGFFPWMFVDFFGR
jgi:hypothetical protein